MAPLAATGQEPWADAASSMVKVREGDALRGARAVALSAARGECEAAQLVTRGPQREVTATADPLVPEPAGPSRAAPSGARPIQPRLYHEAFIQVREPSNSEGRTGWWADPLIPAVDAYVGEARAAFPASSARREPVVVYYEVCVPTSASPGSYTGGLTLRARGRAPLRFPVHLRVRGFAIPATSSLANTFGFSGLTAAAAHGVPPAGPAMRELTRLYATAALAHRISLYGMTMEPPPVAPGSAPVKVDFRAWDAEVGPFLDGTALPNGARFTSIDVRLDPAAETDEQKVAYWRAWARHLREKGWLSRAFVYAKDEPTAEELPQVRHFAQLVHGADPQLRVLVTAGLDPLLEGAADIFAPNLNCLFARPGDRYCRVHLAAAAYQRELASGRQLWWYQSCGSHGCGPIGPLDLSARAYFAGWPSYMVDHDGALNRAMGVLAYRYGVGGELYFDTVAAWRPGPRGEKPEPWVSVWRFHGNGDGTLFYPGAVDRIGGRTDIPVESMRLKSVREGLEDYEYLALAHRLGLGREADAVARQLAPQPYEIARDPARWSQARERLADRIEAALRARGEYPPRPAVQGSP